MGSIKRKCTLCQNVHQTHRLRGAFSTWEVHPSWKIAMDSLDAYSHWVSEIVVPIAFEWIEEHKQEVYDAIPKELHEDVGVVISAAFELVKKSPTYARGLKYGKQIKQEQANGQFDSKQFNPVWTAITARIEKDVREAFTKYKNVLPNTGNE